MPRRTENKKGETPNEPQFRDLRAQLAIRIAQAIKEENVSKLATTLGLSRTAIYDWTSGKFMPDLMKLWRLAELTGVSWSWLCSGYGPMRPGETAPAGYVLLREFPNLNRGARHPPIAFDAEWGANLLSGFSWPEPSFNADSAALARHFADACFLRRIEDDSMSPVLSAGDLVLADGAFVDHYYQDIRGHYPDLSPGNGIFVIKGGAVRRVSWEPDDQMIVSCDNKKHYKSSGRVKRDDDHWRPIGIVLWRSAKTLA